MVENRLPECNDDALQLQRKFKQRQQQLLQSYKHCRRRGVRLPKKVQTSPLLLCELSALPPKTRKYCDCSIERRDSVHTCLAMMADVKSRLTTKWRWANCSRKLWAITVMLLTSVTCLATITGAADPAISPGASITSSSERFHSLLPLTGLLSVAHQPPQTPPTTLSSSSLLSMPQQQRQKQQQQLFALLKLNSIPVPLATKAESKKSVPSASLPTKNLKRKHHRYNHFNKSNDYDYANDDNDKISESDDADISQNRDAAIMETSGFVSDDGQQYEKAEKALGTASDGLNVHPQQQQHSTNNIVNCPKECKCLNDYFDCGKKHLDRVPTLPNYVQIIDFIGNKLNDTTVLQIRNLPQLNKLVLKRNQLESMPKFVGLSSLKQLSLSHNRIQRISSEALAVLPRLKSLDLSKNYLHTVESNYFPNTNRLAHLILNGNEISSIEEDAFQNLPDLLDLELNNNRLTTLPAGVFKSVNKLRKLSLNYNQLEINWSTFRGLTSLQKIFLKSNNIRALQDGVFHVMRSVETIELDHNDISSLSRQGLFNLTKLHHLSLSNNSISRIELDTWEFTQSLISLDLSHNNITEFKPQHLDCLQRLKHLNLAHNKIQYLTENTFDCVKNLEDLNLRRNKLSWIIEDPGASPPFKALRKLKKLDLYGNNLKQINTKSLSGLSSLESLNLGGNALASIQSAAFDHMTHLQKLTFKSLNFICDCEIIWFKHWLERHLQLGNQQQQQRSLPLSSQVLCGYPEHLLDRELLTLQQNELACAETPQPKLSQEPTNQLAVKGANITMECRATSPRAASFSATDELKIKWRHDNHNIKEKDRSAPPSTMLTSYTTTETQIHDDPSNNQTTIIGYLRLYNVSYESAGKYQCVVSNAFGTTYSQKFRISIGIHPSFLQIPSNLTIDSGDTARLVCSATGDPTPEIALQKFGASDFPAATERRLQVLRDENVFVITNAKPIDSGIYTCTAESPAGEIKVNASVIVNDKPQPDIPLIMKEVVVGKSSVLECLNDIAAELNQPHREWYKDNKPFHITPTLDAERYYFTSEKELLIIVNTQSVDSGHYRCEITDNSKTYTILMKLIVVKEDFSQNIIIIGVVAVTVACVVVGSLIIWVILFYQKKKLHISAGRSGTNEGSRIAAAHSQNVLSGGSRVSTLDHTQMTTLNRTYLRSPRDHYNQRPRSLAALELNAGRYQPGEDEHQPLKEQRSCLIVTTTPNYQQLLMQRNANDDRNDDEHLTLEYLRLNTTSHDADHQQDHLSSKDSGTGSDAANKRSLEDFCLTLIPNTSTPTPTAPLMSGGRASLAKQDTDDDDYNVTAVHLNYSDEDIAAVTETPMPTNPDDNEDLTASSTVGVSMYALDANDLPRYNNQSSISPHLNQADGVGSHSGSSSSSLPYLQQTYKTSTNYPKNHTSSPLPHTQTVDI